MSYFSSFVFSCLEVAWISRTGQPEELLNFAFLALVCSANNSLWLQSHLTAAASSFAYNSVEVNTGTLSENRLWLWIQNPDQEMLENSPSHVSQ